MQIRSHIRAGGDAQDLRKCQQERDYWKSQAAYMENLATSPANPKPTAPVPTYPNPTPTPVKPGGGWVGGQFYPDYSGFCS